MACIAPALHIVTDNTMSGTRKRKRKATAIRNRRDNDFYGWKMRRKENIKKMKRKGNAVLIIGVTTTSEILNCVTWFIGLLVN